MTFQNGSIKYGYYRSAFAAAERYTLLFLFLAVVELSLERMKAKRRNLSTCSSEHRPTKECRSGREREKENERENSGNSKKIGSESARDKTERDGSLATERKMKKKKKNRTGKHNRERKRESGKEKRKKVQQIDECDNSGGGSSSTGCGGTTQNDRGKQECNSC